MTLPTASQVLDLWDGWETAPLPDRAAAILDTIDPSASSSITVTERDRRLIDLRRRIIGPRMEMVVACPQCAVEQEFAVDAGDLLAATAGEGADPFEVTIDEWRFVLRTPSSADLIDVASGPSRSEGRVLLVERCVLEAWEGDERRDPAELPADVERRMAASFETALPGSEIQFEVSCVECGHDWRADFDIVSYLWLELGQMVQRILSDVHELASAYGWNESEILSMSARRRRSYIERL